jgi:hypothetical protein
MNAAFEPRHYMNFDANAYQVAARPDMKAARDIGN